MKNFKIYCAGPLFNKKEKEEMLEIATVLETSGFKVFLPHRDGFEFVHLSDTFKKIGISENRSTKLLNKAIFILDVFQVLDSDGLVLNINGRVPDEGAAVEAGIAWNAGKHIVIYKNDARILINGVDNPLLLGLSNFVIINEISEIPNVFKNIFMKNNNMIIGNSIIQKVYKRGKIISKIAQDECDKIKVCYRLLELLEES